MAGDLMAMSGAAYDAQALNGLKRDAASDPQGNLKQVAQQVEGMFVQMMLKSMRAALPQDGVVGEDDRERGLQFVGRVGYELLLLGPGLLNRAQRPAGEDEIQKEQQPQRP